MPPLSTGGLRWLARYASSSSKKLPRTPRLDPPSKASFDASRHTKLPTIPRLNPSPSQPAKPRRPRLLFFYLYRENWRQFKNNFTPEFRRNIWRIAWLLPWIPIVLVFEEHFYTYLWVRGPSMTPTLNPDYDPDTPNTSDCVLVRMWGSARDVSRGEVIAFRLPQDPEKIVIKRVVGVQGDLVQPLPPHPTNPVIIQWGQIWVEGDNDDKTKSKDSNWYGPIARSTVLGTVQAVVWPLNHVSSVTPKDHKDHPRVQKGAVRLRHPKTDEAERTEYWRKEKEKIKRERAARRNAQSESNGEGDLQAVAEKEKIHREGTAIRAAQSGSNGEGDLRAIAEIENA